MLIFVLENEPALLRAARKVIKEAAPDAELMAFSRSDAALKAADTQGLRPDVAFVDVEMSGMSGMEFSACMKTRSPDTRVVLIAGFPQDARGGLKTRTQGFILKPLKTEQVLKELALPARPPAPVPDKLCVQCFGYFGVYWQGKPLIFLRKQAKELFAFLIDRRGASCGAEEIISALWEGEQDIKAAKHRLRTVLHDLKTTLRQIGMEEVLIRERRQMAIRRDKVDCDYYRMLDGDREAISAFHGEYMKDYSWAELTRGRLYFESLKE